MFRYDTLNMLGKITYHAGSDDWGHAHPHRSTPSVAPDTRGASGQANGTISGSTPNTGVSTLPEANSGGWSDKLSGFGQGIKNIFAGDADTNVGFGSASPNLVGMAGGDTQPKTPAIAPKGPGDFDLGTIPLQSEAGLGMSPEDIAAMSEQLRTRFSESDIDPSAYNKRWEQVKGGRGEGAVGALGPDEKKRLEDFFQNQVKGKGFWSRIMDVTGRMSAAQGYQTEGTRELLSAPPVASGLEGGDETVQLQAMYRAAVQEGFSPEVLNSLDTFRGIQTEEGGAPGFVTRDVNVTGPDGGPIATDTLNPEDASAEIQRFASEIAGSWSEEDRGRTAIDLSKIGYTYTPPQYDSQGRVKFQGTLTAGDNAAEISSEDRLKLAESLAKQSDAQNIASQTRTMDIKSQAEMEQLEAAQSWKTDERIGEQEFKSTQARLDRSFAESELRERTLQRQADTAFQQQQQTRQIRIDEQSNKIAKARNTNERLSIDNAFDVSQSQILMAQSQFDRELSSNEAMQGNEFAHQVQMQADAHDYQMAAIGGQGIEQRKGIRAQGQQDRILEQVRNTGAIERLAKQIGADAMAQGRQMSHEQGIQAAELSTRRALQHQELSAEMAQLRQSGRQNIDQTRIAGFVERQNQAERIMADARAQGRQMNSTEALARADRWLQQTLQQRQISGEMTQQLVGGEQKIGQIQEAGIQERITQFAGQQTAGLQELRQIRESGAQARLTQAAGGVQDIASIEARAEEDRETYKYQLEQQEASELRQREALGMDTEQTIDAVRTSTQGYSTNMNAALKQAGETGDYESVNTALAAELPPSPPGITWDSSSGSFQQRGGFQGREISSEAQQWMATAAPAFKARDRAEQAVTQAQKIQMEAQTRRKASEQAQEDFAQAMLTSDIDSAEEAAARHEMAKTAALATEQKMQHVQMLFNLLQNPVQLGMAKRHGLLGQIESALGFSMSGVPESEPGEANLANWQTMDSEDQAFAMADYIEQGGSPDEFMRMVASAAPAQMRQVQYGVL